MTQKNSLVFGQFISKLNEMGISYDTSNLALVRITSSKGATNKDFGLLINSCVFTDRERKQVVSCYNGASYYYFFGLEPTQASIAGIIEAKNLKNILNAYEDKTNTVTITVTKGKTFTCILDDIAYSISAEQPHLCNVTIHLLKVD